MSTVPTSDRSPEQTTDIASASPPPAPRLARATVAGLALGFAAAIGALCLSQGAQQSDGVLIQTNENEPESAWGSIDRCPLHTLTLRIGEDRWSFPDKNPVTGKPAVKYVTAVEEEKSGGLTIHYSFGNLPGGRTVIRDAIGIAPGERQRIVSLLRALPPEATQHKETVWFTFVSTGLQRGHEVTFQRVAEVVARNQ